MIQCAPLNRTSLDRIYHLVESKALERIFIDRYPNKNAPIHIIRSPRNRIRADQTLKENRPSVARYLMICRAVGLELGLVETQSTADHVLALTDRWRYRMTEPSSYGSGDRSGVFTAFFTRPQTWTSKRARDPRK